MANAINIIKNVPTTNLDISAKIDWRTLSLSQVLTKEVAKLEFDMLQVNTPNLPVLGDQIDMWVNGVGTGMHYFAGTVTEVDSTNAGGLLLNSHIVCTDWSFKMDFKLVAKNYALMDPKDIVLDILATFTDGTFTHNHVQKGNFLVTSIKFNYEPVSKALQKLATLIGWDWYIDSSKDLHFFLVDTNPAPFAITDTNGNAVTDSLDVDTNLQNMKNSVYVIGGNYKKTLTAITTPDVYLTDGVKQVFSLAYPYSKTSIVVTLAGASQTVGIDQQDNPAGFQVMYNEKNRFVKFNAVPTTGQTVKIYGDAEIPILAHSSDPAAIALYGEIQSSIVDKLISSVPQAQMRADAEVAMYGHAVYTIKFDTRTAGLFAGQTLTFTSALFATGTLTLVIRRVTAVGYSPSTLIYSIEAYGSDVVTFVDLMSQLLLAENNANPVDDQTVLENLIPVAEPVTISDALTATATTPPYQWGPTGSPQLRWGFSEWK